MHVQVIITPPSGMSVTSSEFVQSGAGLFTASYEIEPGVGRDIEVRMRSNQVGDFVVNGRIVYYFGDDMDDAEDHTLTLPITVRAGAEAGVGAGVERTTGTSGSEGSSTPGFAAVVAVIGLLAVYLRRKRI
jgi:PGF-CTERM protein